jgi:hypothetical protein
MIEAAEMTRSVTPLARLGELEKGPVTSVGMGEQRVNPYICVVSNVIENGIAIGSHR